VAPTQDAVTVTFARTDLLGVYAVTGIPDPDAALSPSAGASADPSPSATAGTGAGAGASPGASPTFRPSDPGAPVRFAVDLLDVNESTIAPGDAAKLTALGRPAASPGTGAGAGAAERPNARDELWIPIVLVALLILTAEWLVYERDTLARLRRALAARFGRARPASKGGSA